jgi:acyl carrier protein
MKNKDRLIALFKDTFDDQDLNVTDDVSPANYDLWDSVETVNLVMSVEREFGIQFSIEDVAAIKNFGKLWTIVEKYI